MAQIQSEMKTKVKRLHSDRGGEVLADLIKDRGYRFDAQQVDATTMRCVARWGAGEKLSFGKLDVSTAFLNAKLPKDMKIAIEPPSLLKTWGYVQEPKERWVLESALYGLRVSPRVWQDTRDKALKKARVGVRRLQAPPEAVPDRPGRVAHCGTGQQSFGTTGFLC